MKSAKRRGFLCLALSTLSGLPYLNTLGLNGDSPDIVLARSDVESGLKRGLEFSDQDKEVLAFLKTFSDRQVMIGGCVLTLAAQHPTEWIHLLVRLDSLEKFVATMNDPDVPWVGAQVSHGNTLAFEYEGQLYYIETLLERDFLKRLKNLKEPGSEKNGFRQEFAHDAFLYDLQKKSYSDPFEAIGRRNHVALKRIAPENGIPSAIRILTEEKSLGLAIPQEEREFAERTMGGIYARKRDSQEDTMELLSGVSRLAEYVDSSEIHEVMISSLAVETVEENLGENVRKFASLRQRLESVVSKDSTEGALWHLSMRCLEDTKVPECEVAAELALQHLGGYDDFYTKRDLSAGAQEIAENSRVRRERSKEPTVVQLSRDAEQAPRPTEIKKSGDTIYETGSHSSVGSRKRIYIKRSGLSSDTFPMPQHSPERLEELKNKMRILPQVLPKRTIPEN